MKWMLITLRLHVDEGQEAPFCCAFILVAKQTVFIFHHVMMASSSTFLATWKFLKCKLPHPICPTSLSLNSQKHSILATSSIHCILLCCLHCNPRLSEEYLHLWSASRWRSMKTMYASFATWSTAIRVRMGERWGGGEGACTQIANVWERADFHRREVRLNCSKSGAEVANTLGLKTQPA